ncbi:MAG TPA: beta-ketoacyl-[acyl-carrier-protein] synthase family protein [Chitinophagaceae bacterium]|nr:beta-ketoacyl-[acyl-carrier-protein] synthase family protein [Chitinophagaceae bacterium]
MYKASEGVYVAGVGVVSAVGNNTASCLQSLETGRAGIGNITLLDSIHKNAIPVAEVKLSNQELAASTGLPATRSRTALLAMMAAREAWQDADIENIPGLRTGFVSANSVGGMDKTELFFPGFLTNTTSGHLHQVANHECGAVTELVADALGIKHYVTTISTACSSSANSIFFGARLIRHQLLDVVVAGGADALTKFTLNGFNTLQILDRSWCQPFDENRRGLNLGEGAGYLVLVSEKLAAKLANKPYCKLSGYANANDAHHQTASSPDGAGSFAAMQSALAMTGLPASAISYINLHGTGTYNNDISEGTAIKRLFAPHFPRMSSTKAFTGHTLGASGGIEAVFSALAIRHGIIYPNLRLDTPMQALPFVPETSFQKGIDVQHVLSNSFGFGGNCSSLIFSKL